MMEGRVSPGHGLSGFSPGARKGANLGAMFVSTGKRSRAIRRLAPLLLLVFGALAGVGAIVGQPALPTQATTTEEVVVVRQVLVAAPDGSVAFEEESREIAELKVNPNLWDAEHIPVPVRYNADGEPGGLNVPGVLQTAVGTWNGAGSGFSFTFAGNSDGDTGTCLDDFETDGVNTIRFHQLSGLTLGRTCTIFGRGKLVEFDMELDSDANWSVATPVPRTSYDLPTTVLHELGHAAGLGHSCRGPKEPFGSAPECTGQLRGSVMYGVIGAGESRRELTADDLEAIRMAYPLLAATPTATATATPMIPATNVVPAPTQSAPFPLYQVRVRAMLLSRD